MVGFDDGQVVGHVDHGQFRPWYVNHGRFEPWSFDHCRFEPW